MIKKNFYLSCSYYLLTNLLRYIQYKTGGITTSSGTHHSALPVKESVNYIFDVFNDYKKYSGTTFAGKVAEIGPGDNCGVGLLLLAEGADSVDLVDRFYSNRNPQAHAEIYSELIKIRPVLRKFINESHIEDESSFKGVNRWYGASAAAEIFFKKNKGYNFIISRAVFEHLYDPALALQMMSTALVYGGYLIHKVDLRDHGLFSAFFHELKYLEINNWIYRKMTMASGRPNRFLVNEYRNVLESSGLSFEILVTRLAGVGDIIPHKKFEDIEQEKREQAISYVRSARNKFADKFKIISDEDLSVTGIFIVAKKT